MGLTCRRGREAAARERAGERSWAGGGGLGRRVERLREREEEAAPSLGVWAELVFLIFFSKHTQTIQFKFKHKDLNSN